MSEIFEQKWEKNGKRALERKFLVFYVTLNALIRTKFWQITRYSKITPYSAINRGRIIGRFGVKKGYYRNQYSCMNDDIRASSNRACNRAST